MISTISQVDVLPRRHRYIILGDMNVRVGSQPHMQWPSVMGNYGFGNKNDRGFCLLQFCAMNDLFIANTNFKHKTVRRFTWISIKKFDYIIIPSRIKNTLKNYRAYQSTDIGSNHSLMTPKKPKPLKAKPKKYDVSKLTNNFVKILR